MSRALLPCLVLVGGCELAIGGGAPTFPNDPDPTDCAVGLFEPASISVAPVLLVAGIEAPLEFDPDAALNGRPAACINAAGTEAELVLATDGTPQGSLRFFVPDANTYLLADNTGFSLRLSLDSPELDDDPIEVSTWDGGVMDVTSVGSLLELNVANAVGTTPNGLEVVLEVFVEASP